MYIVQYIYIYTHVCVKVYIYKYIYILYINILLTQRKALPKEMEMRNEVTRGPIVPVLDLVEGNLLQDPLYLYGHTPTLFLFSFYPMIGE